MGGEQAASVLATVKRDGIEAKGGKWSKEEEQEFKRPILEQYEKQGHPYYATARLGRRRHRARGNTAHAGGGDLGFSQRADRGNPVRRFPNVEAPCPSIRQPSSGEGPRPISSTPRTTAPCVAV